MKKNITSALASALDEQTPDLCALDKSQELQNKAAAVGFEWDHISDILDKLEEEIEEMRAAITNNDPVNQAEELGDILFLLSNYGRNLGISSKHALSLCNEKFERRFRGLESDLHNKGIDISDATLDQMEEAWREQKIKERG